MTSREGYVSVRIISTELQFETEMNKKVELTGNSGPHASQKNGIHITKKTVYKKSYLQHICSMQLHRSALVWQWLLDIFAAAPFLLYKGSSYLRYSRLITINKLGDCEVLVNLLITTILITASQQLHISHPS